MGYDDSTRRMSVAAERPVVADRYELLDLMGSGAMGSVFSALDRSTGRVVAVKRLHAQRSDDEVARARLRTEARCLARIAHRGLPEIYDHGEEVVGPATHPWLAMRLVLGDPLSVLLGRGRRLPVERALGLVSETADALAAIHDGGIVHRDVKPANVMVQPDGRPVLIDFGIASIPGQEPLTQTGQVLGTMAYVSPEQVSGERATAASDVYSLGVLAYQALSGVRPFQRDTPVASALAHVTDPPPALTVPLDAEERDLLAAMLAKSPADRPTAHEVADGLGPVDRTMALPPA